MDSFECFTPDGARVAVEIQFQEILLHFADRTESLSLNASTGDLNAVRHYLREAIRSAPIAIAQRAVIWLGQLESPWTLLMLEALGSPRIQVRRSATYALDSGRDRFQKSAVDALSHAAGNDPDPVVQRVAGDSLFHFGGGEVDGDALLGARPGLFRRMVTKFLIEAEALETERLAQPERILQDRNASGEQKTAAPELLPEDDLSHSDTSIGNRIGALRDSVAVEPMIEILRGTRTGRPRAAVAALTWLRDARCAPDLISVLRTGSSRIRAEAAKALGEVCDPRAIVPLAAAMIKGDESLRLAATQAMTEFARAYRDPACFEPLITRLMDAPEIRLWAAWGLNFLNDPRACEPLRAALFLPDVESPVMYFSDVPHTAQQAVAAALAGLDDEIAADDFVRVLNMEGAPALDEALVGLARLRDPRVLPHGNRAFRFGLGPMTIAGRNYKPEELKKMVEEALRAMGARQTWPGPMWKFDADNTA